MQLWYADAAKECSLSSNEKSTINSMVLKIAETARHVWANHGLCIGIKPLLSNWGGRGGGHFGAASGLAKPPTHPS